MLTNSAEHVSGFQEHRNCENGSCEHIPRTPHSVFTGMEFSRVRCATACESRGSRCAGFERLCHVRLSKTFSTIHSLWRNVFSSTSGKPFKPRRPQNFQKNFLEQPTFSLFCKGGQMEEAALTVQAKRVGWEGECRLFAEARVFVPRDLHA